MNDRINSFTEKSIHGSEQLQFALDLAGIGTWELDLRNQQVYWDEHCKKLYGFSKDDSVAYEQILQYIHPQDQILVRDTIAKTLASVENGFYDIQFRTIGAEDKVLRWIHCKGQAYFDEYGQAYRFRGIAQDITELRDVQQQMATSEQLAELALEGANAGWFTIHMEAEQLEHSLALSRILTGTEQPNVSRTVLIEHVHPDDLVIRELAYQIAGQTGKLHYEARFIWDDGSIHWVRMAGTYHYDTNGQPQRFSGIAQDITAEVMARQQLEASEERFRSIVEQAPVATCLFVGKEMRIAVANEIMIHYWGKDSSVLGKPLTEAVPELAGQPFLNILNEVYTTGKAYEAREAPAQLQKNGVLDTYYFDFTYKPLLNAAGEVYAIMDMAIDVTQAVKARQKLEESELFARSIIYNSPVAKLVLTGEDMVITTINENMLLLLGKDESITGLSFKEAIPELYETPLMDRMLHVLKTGETFYQPEEKLELIKHGKPYTGYYNYIYKALYNTSHVSYGLVVTATEITEQVLARQKIEEAEIALRGAIELAQLATWSMDVETRAFTYSERFMDWLGISENGLEEVQAYEPLPEEYREAIPAAINAALDPASDGVYENEHPIINQKTGEIRIIHAQGQVIYDAARKPLVIRGTAQDITEQRIKQEQLEQQVKLRTEELAIINEALATANTELIESNQLLMRSNNNLEQFAYIASHDLQEPLRKIQSFGDLLKNQYGDSLGEGVHILERMQLAANRMSMLIKDLLTFSRLTNQAGIAQPVDLAQVIQTVLNELDLRIQETRARISADPLPVIQGDSSQLGQLFQNLLSNSLKFHKPGVSPDITITYSLIATEELPNQVKPVHQAKEYHRIVVADNGIGFDEQYSEQIFQVFQRLHGKTEYAGTGIGLAICEKVVVNHGGAIKASSVLGEGSTFQIYFPQLAERL